VQFGEFGARSFQVLFDQHAASSRKMLRDYGRRWQEKLQSALGRARDDASVIAAGEST
jgi:hypothetical protein